MPSLMYNIKWDFENDFNLNDINDIDITQSSANETKFDKLILSIFSQNGEHIAGSEIRKLSYTIRYSTYSNYGIYNFNDIYDKNGEIEIVQSDKDERNFTINL